LRYSTAAVLDGYEVLRQLIDDAEKFEGLFVAVHAGLSFAGDDPKRSVAAYTALKERIWGDVHPRGHENPLAPLLQLSNNRTAGKAAPREIAELPFVEERVAVEALRAGVPNRAAIRLLGTDERALYDPFMDRLIKCKSGLSNNRAIGGEIIAGGF